MPTFAKASVGAAKVLKKKAMDGLLLYTEVVQFEKPHAEYTENADPTHLSAKNNRLIVNLPLRGGGRTSSGVDVVEGGVLRR